MVYVQICFVIIVNGRNTFRQIIKAFIFFLRTLVRIHVLSTMVFYIKITAPRLGQCKGNAVGCLSPGVDSRFFVTMKNNLILNSKMF